MRLKLLLPLLVLALSPAVFAQDVPELVVEPIAEGTATPGEEWTLRVSYRLPENYVAYHKDNPGLSEAPKVRFTELSGLELIRTDWPEYKEKYYPDIELTEWVIDHDFELAFVFRVPADASGELVISATHSTQYCDDVCFNHDGEFTVRVPVAGGSAPAPEPSEPVLVSVSATFNGDAAPGGRAELAVRFDMASGYWSYHKDTGLSGYGMPPGVIFDSAPGLTLVETIWPEPKRKVIEDDWFELIYPDQFTLVFVFDVAQDAAGEVAVRGRYEVQVCDDDG